MAAQQAADRASIVNPRPGIWDIDTSHTSLEFVARHIFTKVRGRFEDFSGTITIAEDPELSSAEATIQTASVKTFDERRDGHLRSPDFFAAEEWPQISFQSTSIVPLGGNRYRVSGNLTVRGVTRPIDLETDFRRLVRGSVRHGARHIHRIGACEPRRVRPDVESRTGNRGVACREGRRSRAGACSSPARRRLTD
jgi:polyisoprenoid-binding protein YceI